MESWREGEKLCKEDPGKAGWMDVQKREIPKIKMAGCVRWACGDPPKVCVAGCMQERLLVLQLGLGSNPNSAIQPAPWVGLVLVLKVRVSLGLKNQTCPQAGLD